VGSTCLPLVGERQYLDFFTKMRTTQHKDLRHWPKISKFVNILVFNFEMRDFLSLKAKAIFSAWVVDKDNKRLAVGK